MFFAKKNLKPTKQKNPKGAPRSRGSLSGALPLTTAREGIIAGLIALTAQHETKMV